VRSVFSIGLYFPRLGLIALLLIPMSVQSQSAQLDERGLTQRKTDKAEQHFALVIGNSSYADAPLKNSVNDARGIAQALRKLGFEVIHQQRDETIYS